MKLVLLGTGGYFPTSWRHTACLMLPEIGVALDAGSGICNLAQHLQTDRLDIFLTHAHLDHVSGLTTLINTLAPRVADATIVHATEDVLDAVRDHLFAEAIFPVRPPFRFETLRGPIPLQPAGTLTPIPLTHPGGATGFRLDWPNRSLAYITDTTASHDAPYLDAIRGVDLLIHECYFVEDPQRLASLTGHSDLISVAHLAEAAQPRRL
ncbi:MAG: ribonuclease Z, partial [Pirellulales bacterium]|nr:ribonuclease Z [Pirellulales bacterium]